MGSNAYSEAMDKLEKAFTQLALAHFTEPDADVHSETRLVAEALVALRQYERLSDDQIQAFMDNLPGAEGDDAAS